MTDRKISELTNITGADVDDANDELVIVDTSTSESRAITRAELFSGVDGNITLSGTVDGRDVAADGSKLDGIESNATADQTASEIKTAYESNADTNAFTDAEQTKLSNVETNADVTDTANVTAAGALMDSELTSEASVKALDQGVATTDSPDFAGLTVDTDTLYVNSTSNRVGIGTTNVGEKLVVSRLGGEPAAMPTLDGNTAALFHSGTGATGSGVALTLLGGTTSNCSLFFADTDDGNIGSIAYRHLPNAMLFRVNNSERMRIDGTGNVGIGTSSPSDKLDVNGSIKSTGNPANLKLQGTNATVDASRTTLANFDDDFFIQSRNSSNNFIANDYVIKKGNAGATSHQWKIENSEAMRIDSSGNVGIGTSSPNAPLDIEYTGPNTGFELTRTDIANAKLQIGWGGADINFNTAGASKDIVFRQNNTESMRIDSSRNVGIGTSSPGSRLSVVGLPTSSAGLSAGDIYIDAGTLKIVT